MTERTVIEEYLDAATLQPSDARAGVVSKELRKRLEDLWHELDWRDQMAVEAELRKRGDMVRLAAWDAHVRPALVILKKAVP